MNGLRSIIITNTSRIKISEWRVENSVLLGGYGRWKNGSNAIGNV